MEVLPSSLMSKLPSQWYTEAVWKRQDHQGLRSSGKNRLLLLNQVKNSVTKIPAEGTHNMEWVMEEDSYDYQFWLCEQ